MYTALEFREKLGGEKRINEYCHNLAVKGGKRLAELFQTSAISDDFTANMVCLLQCLNVFHQSWLIFPATVQRCPAAARADRYHTG